jgi:DNA-binding PadR family transcriptional regulator
VARTVQRFEMGGTEVVLGLLIERPGTRYELDQRLSERFGSAQFGRGTASSAMNRLAANGLLRICGDRRRTYVPTQAGVEHFRRWIRSAVSTPPVREELHARLALCEQADLPAIIQVVEDAEKRCAAKLQGLHWRMRGTEEQQPTMTRDWSDRRGLLVQSGDVAWWDGRIKWLQSLRIALEKERQLYEAERPSTSTQ